MVKVQYGVCESNCGTNNIYMNYLLNIFRHLWDEDLLKWRVIDRLDNETEVFQFVLNSMAPHPTRDFVEIR